MTEDRGGFKMDAHGRVREGRAQWVSGERQRFDRWRALVRTGDGGEPCDACEGVLRGNLMWKGAVVDLEPRRSGGRGFRDRREFLRMKKCEIREGFLFRKDGSTRLGATENVDFRGRKECSCFVLEPKAGTHQ